MLSFLLSLLGRYVGQLEAGDAGYAGTKGAMIPFSS